MIRIYCIGFYDLVNNIRLTPMMPVSAAVNDQEALDIFRNDMHSLWDPHYKTKIEILIGFQPR